MKESAAVGPPSSAATSADERHDLALTLVAAKRATDVEEEKRDECRADESAVTSTRTTGGQDVVHPAWARLASHPVDDSGDEYRRRRGIEKSCNHVISVALGARRGDE